MKTLAVVVTHNRVELLSRCIDHLQSQIESPDAILIIDNASTDSTVSMLTVRGIDFLTQENVGSAGGWHRGIAAALDGQYDAVWLMDDDGFPGPSALAALKHALVPVVACASSVVLCEDDQARFVFPFPRLDENSLPILLGPRRKVSSLSQLRAISSGGTYPFAHLFNGALINVDAIRKIGNVNRDFFIFGDEVDYFFRLRQVGAVVSVLSAAHFHPDVSQRPYTPVKIYYYVKNTLVLNQRYLNGVWVRHVMTVAVALQRTAQRNGFLTALSYIFGRNMPTLARAIVRGLRGQVAKDFNG